MDRIHIYVKYCGGCNPRYNRGNAIAEILSSTINDISFSLVTSPTAADVILYVCGCTSRCIVPFPIEPDKKILWIVSLPDKELLIRQIHELIQKK